MVFTQNANQKVRDCAAFSEKRSRACGPCHRGTGTGMDMSPGTGLPVLPQPPWGAAAKVLHGVPAAGCASTLP